MIERIGIIGVGAVGASVVDGLCGTAAPPQILLSPRSSQVSQALAARYPNVTVAADNQAVVDQSPALLLSVRPDQVDGALSALRVPDDRLVISAVAGWPIPALRELLGEGPQIVRTIPLPAVRQRDGVTAVHPGHPEVEQLFNTLGGTLVADTQSAFDAIAGATATISSYLQYQAQVAEWVALQGISHDIAENYVRSMFAGVTATLTGNPAPLSELLPEYETPGGLNAAVRSTWFDAASEQRLDQVLDDVKARVAKGWTRPHA